MRRWSRKRKALVAVVGTAGVLGLLYLWLPYRIAVTQLYIRLGGSRLTIPAEYSALDSPTYVGVAESKGYADDSEVVGVEINGEARAIPVKRLAWHLVMHDRIGGEDVAVTLCTVSDAAIAYSANSGGRVLRFKPARLERNNLVLRDEETRSSWQQFTGKAIDGPMAGAELRRVPLERMRLREWRKRHPGGRVVAPLASERDRTAPNDSCPVMSHFPNRPFLLQGPTHEDGRLERKRRVVGTIEDGKALAWPGSRREQPQPNLDVMCYWFAWVEFHPDTELRE